MRLVTYQENGKVEDAILSHRDALGAMHKIGEQIYHGQHQKLTTDMDGVLIPDDNAVEVIYAIGGNELMAGFSQVADWNLEAHPELPYCWNAPALLGGMILSGLPIEVNKIIGERLRLLPGVEEHFDLLGQLGYDVTNVTAGHQEAAEEVSRRIGIENTVGTQFETLSEGYYGQAIERFIGGVHKLSAVEEILFNTSERKLYGTHIGDSHSDVETMAELPFAIAWNAKYDMARARVMVYGTNKNGLTPLFDLEGKMDDRIDADQMPEVVVVFENRPAESVIGNYDQWVQDSGVELGIQMRQKIADELNRRGDKVDEMRSNIRIELDRRLGLTSRDFEDHVERIRKQILLTEENFMKMSREAYRGYCNKK